MKGIRKKETKKSSLYKTPKNCKIHRFSLLQGQVTKILLSLALHSVHNTGEKLSHIYKLYTKENTHKKNSCMEKYSDFTKHVFGYHEKTSIY